MNPAPSFYPDYERLTLETPVPTLERTSAEIRDRSVSDANILRQENAELREALRQIRDLSPREKEFPLDWGAIDKCADCQSYKNHPIQNGICDTHRKPIWAHESHDAFERQALGPRARIIASEALLSKART